MLLSSSYCSNFGELSRKNAACRPTFPGTCSCLFLVISVNIYHAMRSVSLNFPMVPFNYQLSSSRAEPHTLPTYPNVGILREIIRSAPCKTLLMATDVSIYSHHYPYPANPLLAFNSPEFLSSIDSWWARLDSNKTPEIHTILTWGHDMVTRGLLTGFHCYPHTSTLVSLLLASILDVSNITT